MVDVNINIKDLRGHPRLYELIEEIAYLHHKKNTDYATKEDPLQNFTRVGDLCKRYNITTKGREGLKTAIAHMFKQLDGALKLIMNDEEGMVEGVPARLKDVAVYTLISIILYEEGK